MGALKRITRTSPAVHALTGEPKAYNTTSKTVTDHEKKIDAINIGEKNHKHRPVNVLIN